MTFLDIAPFGIYLLGIMFVHAWSYRPYIVPRETLLALGGLGLVWAGLLSNGAMFFVSREMLVGTLVLIGWWFIASMLAKQVEHSLRRTFVYVGVIGLALVSQSAETKILAYSSMVMVLVNLWPMFKQVYGLKTRNKWFSRQAHEKTRLVGHLANPNHYGVWLLGPFFMSFWLIENVSIYWIWASASIGTMVVFSKCRGAITGMLAGLLVLVLEQQSSEVYRYLGIFVSLGLAAILILGRRLGTLKERLNYWRVAIWHWTESPLWGHGLDSFKRDAYEGNIRLNSRTKGRFLSEENYHNPMPEYTHNDWLQHLSDGGLVNVLAVGYLYWVCFTNYVDANMFAGLVGLSVSGLLFYTFHSVLHGWFLWVFMFGCTRGGVEIELSLGSMGLMAGLTLVGIVLIGRWALVDYLLKLYTIRDSQRAYNMLSFVAENDSSFNTEAMIRNASKGDRIRALRHATKAVEFFDGEKVLCQMWHNLGFVYMMWQQFDLAKWAFKRALTAFPRYKESKKALTVCNVELRKKEKENEQDVVVRHSPDGKRAVVRNPLIR